MFRFPWGDMHSLNLGWFLQKFNELREDWATAEAGIDGALDAEIQRAEDALSDVFDARDAAAASATAAAGSATAAGTSATAAQNSATAAASSATLANQKATAAGLSEAAAAQSATAAGNSATAAATSATQAGQSATNAAGSATAAGQEATNAAGSATAAADSATAASNSATAAAASASAAAQSASNAAASAASIEFTDISNQISLDTTNFTILGQSILKLKEMIFFSIRVKANRTDPVLGLWRNMPISGATGPGGAAPWVRCPAQGIEYETNIATPNIAVCVIADKTLLVKGTIQDHYYEISGFFKTNFTT